MGGRSNPLESLQGPYSSAPGKDASALYQRLVSEGGENVFDGDIDVVVWQPHVVCNREQGCVGGLGI